MSPHRSRFRYPGDAGVIEREGGREGGVGLVEEVVRIKRAVTKKAPHKAEVSRRARMTS
jgi:hypothetical protein